jgi:hypothetical protein
MSSAETLRVSPAASKRESERKREKEGEGVGEETIINKTNTMLPHHRTIHHITTVLSCEYYAYLTTLITVLLYDLNVGRWRHLHRQPENRRAQYLFMFWKRKGKGKNCPPVSPAVHIIDAR